MMFLLRASRLERFYEGFEIRIVHFDRMDCWTLWRRLVSFYYLVWAPRTNSANLAVMIHNIIQDDKQADPTLLEIYLLQFTEYSLQNLWLDQT